MSLPQPPLGDCKNVKSAYVQPTDSDLTIHALHAGQHGDPLVLILHGFPEIAFSWRKVADSLSTEGYYIVAPDTRGNGLTTGWDDNEYNKTNLSTFSVNKLMQDALVLVRELGYSEVHCLVGHDAGAHIASVLALARPDIFRRLVLVSHPYAGPPIISTEGRRLQDEQPSGRPKEMPEPILSSLAALSPPRKPYKWYYAGPEAAEEMLEPLADLKTFLRGYFYLKSASWPGNDPKPLTEWSASELAKMPYYYTMPLQAGMREAVRLELESSGCDPRASETWLSDDDLDVYATAFAHTGFQGALNWYRVATSRSMNRDLFVYSGMRMQPPVAMILGEKDWGAYQIPRSLEKMPQHCDNFLGVKWIEGAGHFPHMEQPAVVAKILSTVCHERV